VTSTLDAAVNLQEGGHAGKARQRLLLMGWGMLVRNWRGSPTLQHVLNGLYLPQIVGQATAAQPQHPDVLARNAWLPLLL